MWWSGATFVLPPLPISSLRRECAAPCHAITVVTVHCVVGRCSHTLQCTAHLPSLPHPQFHTIPENDLFWGRNFTEWDNLKRSFFSPASFRPIPHPLASTGGYYNLLSPEHRRRMALTARAYGVHGFCYHHYWFGCNRTLLEQPLLRLLEDGEPDLPFCLLWANEEWSQRWGGKLAGARETVLVPQTYECEDCWRQHFMWLLPFFKHRNYIKVRMSLTVAGLWERNHRKMVEGAIL